MSLSSVELGRKPLNHLHGLEALGLGFGGLVIALGLVKSLRLDLVKATDRLQFLDRRSEPVPLRNGIVTFQSRPPNFRREPRALDVEPALEP
jgi:hypothetical protein